MKKSLSFKKCLNEAVYKEITKEVIEPAELDFYDGFQYGDWDNRSIDDIVEERYQVWVDDYKSNIGKSEDNWEGWEPWIKNNPEDYSKDEIVVKFKEAFKKALKDHNEDFDDSYTLKEFGIKEEIKESLESGKVYNGLKSIPGYEDIDLSAWESDGMISIILKDDTFMEENKMYFKETDPDVLRSLNSLKVDIETLYDDYASIILSKEDLNMIADAIEEDAYDEDEEDSKYGTREDPRFTKFYIVGMTQKDGKEVLGGGFADPVGYPGDGLKRAIAKAKEWLEEEDIDVTYVIDNDTNKKIWDSKVDESYYYDDEIDECIHNHYDVETAHEFVGLDDTAPKSRRFDGDKVEIYYDDEFEIR